MTKDFIGNELKVGDTVIFVRPHYRDLVTGKIESITAKKCKISYICEQGCYGCETSRFHSDLIKHPKQ